MLSQKQLLAARLLGQGERLRSVAAQLSVSRGTVWRWKKDPAFAAMLAAAEKGHARTSDGRPLSDRDLARSVVRRAAEGEAIPAQQLQAALQLASNRDVLSSEDPVEQIVSTYEDGVAACIEGFFDLIDDLAASDVTLPSERADTSPMGEPNVTPIHPLDHTSARKRARVVATAMLAALGAADQNEEDHER